MEIITWIIQGGVEHKDSEQHSGVIIPGEAQRMSAGRGIYHSEMNGSPVLRTSAVIPPSFRAMGISRLYSSERPR